MASSDRNGMPRIKKRVKKKTKNNTDRYDPSPPIFGRPNGIDPSSNPRPPGPR